MVISVSNDQIVVNSRRVADVAEMKPTQTGLIPGLEQELRDEAKRRGEVPSTGFDVTVMGDREIPYWLLKRIMMTCQATDFANVSLAVNRTKAAQPDEAPVGNATAAVTSPQAGGAS